MCLCHNLGGTLLCIILAEKLESLMNDMCNSATWGHRVKSTVPWIPSPDQRMCHLNF